MSRHSVCPVSGASLLADDRRRATLQAHASGLHESRKSESCRDRLHGACDVLPFPNVVPHHFFFCFLPFVRSRFVDAVDVAARLHACFPLVASHECHLHDCVITIQIAEFLFFL